MTTLISILISIVMLAPVNEETVDSKQWLVHFEAAQQALQDRNFKVARDHLLKVVSLLENEPSSLILLARCESQLNRIEDGIASLTKAVNAGWEDFRQLETEVDLARLRESPSFSRIVQQARENFDRSYLIIDGSLAERNEPAPLVLLLHGRGELPHMQARIWEEAAKANGWILVVPKGVRRLGPVYAWEKVGATETWQVARAEILRRCQKYHADIQKSHAIGPCIVAGFSQGGVAALEVLNGNPETIRGAVLFASAFPTAEQEPAYLENLSVEDHVIQIHVGAKDPWRNGNRFLAKKLKEAGAQVTYREWEGLEHQMPANHTKVIADSVNAILQSTLR